MCVDNYAHDEMWIGFFEYSFQFNYALFLNANISNQGFLIKKSSRQSVSQTFFIFLQVVRRFR